jgi:methionine-rich copper-binding protein CopC
MDLVTRFVSAFLAALVLVLVGSSSADAHATLIATSPENGARIATAPTSIGLTFSEAVGSSFVAVTAPDGSKVKTSAARVTGGQVTAEVAASDQRGRYTVAYRVVSDDGHPVTGTFTFTTTSGRTVTQKNPPASGADSSSEPFLDRHSGTILVAALAISVLAIGVILTPLVRRRSE